MKIIAQRVLAKELRPGDLFSTAGPEYWDVSRLGIVGERVYIRMEEPTPPDQMDTVIYRITITPPKRPEPAYPKPYYPPGHRGMDLRQYTLEQYLNEVKP